MMQCWQALEPEIARVEGEVATSRVQLQEGEVRLELNLVTLPGFGDNIDNTGCWAPIRWAGCKPRLLASAAMRREYIRAQYAHYLHQETLVSRVEASSRQG